MEKKYTLMNNVYEQGEGETEAKHYYITCFKRKGGKEDTL